MGPPKTGFFFGKANEKWIRFSEGPEAFQPSAVPGPGQNQSPEPLQRRSAKISLGGGGPFYLMYLFLSRGGGFRAQRQR